MSGAAEIRLLAPAKVNLFLELLQKRPDGYHELETLMVSIDLCDELVIREATDGERSTLSTEWADGVVAQQSSPNSTAFASLPPQEKNLAYKALELLRTERGVKTPFAASLIKRIPSEAGLGGASADAAASLLAGNELWRLGLSISELSALAAKLGSDVAFFLQGGYAVCRGRGERVTPIDDLPPIWVVVVKPPFGLSTPRVYSQCKIPPAPCQIDGVLEAMRTRDELKLSSQLVNRLWAPALDIEPRLNLFPQAFSEAGLVAHQMSGSGSSYFGVTFDRLKAIRAASILRNRELGFTWVGRGGEKSGTKNACNASHDTLSS